MNLVLFRQIITALIISVVAFIYLSCDDAGVVKPDDEQYCISGTISGWSLGAKTLHAYLRSSSHSSYSIANCPVDAGGNFNLCLPSSLSDTTLFSSDSIFYSGCTGGNVTFDPPYGKGTDISSFRIKSGDTTVGYIRRNNYDTLYPGAFSVMYIYADKNITVSGYKICTNDTLNFNGTATSGWSKAVKNCLRVAGPGTTYLYNTSEPSGALWKFY